VLMLLVVEPSTSGVDAFGPQPSNSYLPNCASSNQYGWPRFESKADLETDAKWTAYFKAVYGEIPEQYPVCIFDFWSINKEAYNAVGLAGSHTFQSNPKDVQVGDLFNGISGQYMIYHSQWTPVPNNTWVEVQHAVFPTELVGAWVWSVRGAGIFVNTGRTLVFPTPSDPSQTHAAAIAFLRKGCTVEISNKWPQMESDIFGGCAREKGYDSIQFEPQEGQDPIGTFGLTGLTEMVLVNLDGNKGCGVATPSKTLLRAGWDASHQCNCTNKPIADSCGLMAKPPKPIIFEQPRLCELREKSIAASCTGATCNYWHCPP